MDSVAVIGASLAGLRAIETLRRDGFEGRIHLVGAERHRPYDRPPLSKQILAGDWETERIWLTSDEALSDLGCEPLFGVSAVALDPETLQVDLSTGDALDVDGVVIATGARTRTLGDPLGGVFTLRTVDDAQSIAAAFDQGPDRVVVIGAGFIGAEVASTARERGIAVTMIEAAQTPFERSLGTEMGAVIVDMHRDQGVDVRVGVTCEELIGEQNVTGVRLSDGSVIDATVVVVGIGVTPNIEWLVTSGLDITNGVLCDATMLAAPRIVAAGDVARWPNRLFDEVMRVEHWDNATGQAVHAAKRLLHGSSVGEYAPVPWFWTDQYDRKIQLAGRTTGFDEVIVVEGAVEDRRFAALYRKADRLVGVLGFNRPRHVMRYRGLIESRTSWSDAMAAQF